MVWNSRKKQDASPPRRRQGSDASADRRTVAAERQSRDDVATGNFRRNRTLTGSKSSHVDGTKVSATDLKSSRTHAHELTAHRRRLGGILVGVLVIAATCFGLLYQLTASSSVYSTDHIVKLDEARYQKAIESYLSQYPVERLRFMMDQTRMTRSIQQDNPEVIGVRQAGFGGIGTSKFNVTVRKPVASWQIRDRLYFVDANGVSFERNYYEAPAVRIVDNSGAQHADGTAIASKRFLTFVGQAVSLAADRQAIVEQAIIPPGTTRQVELRLKDRPYGIKLSLDRSIGEQIEDMQRASAYLDLKKSEPKYLDVRVSGRAFYRD